MCIIIDANRLGAFFNPSEDSFADVEPIRKWLRQGGKLVYSTAGKFKGEILGKARERLKEYRRRGLAKLPSETAFNNALREVKEKEHLLRSDDTHVLALAKATGVRVLFTGDRNLMNDFRNKAIIDPLGRIYSSRRNANLLHRNTCP